MKDWNTLQNNPNDEYYTRYEDVTLQLDEFDLSDKIVYCPADGEESAFVKYFKQPGTCKELIYTSDDFRTHEDIFQKVDIVVTNPPFSLKTTLRDILNKYNKDYILVLPVVPPVRLIRSVFYFRRLNRFSNTPNTVLCQWVSTIGSKTHPYGYSHEELHKHPFKIGEPTGYVKVHSRFGGTLPKYNKRNGFPPRDFDSPFVVPVDCQCSELEVLDSCGLLGQVVRYRTIL